MFHARTVAFGDSNIGLVRENNEDRFCIDEERGFFFVVDGMGGHKAGETAAEIARSTIQKRLERNTGSVPDRIREAITLANNDIFRQANENRAFQGMACVLTVAVIENGLVTAGHVGDSRLYLLTGEKIEKITRDHSPVGVLEDACKISEIEAIRHPNRNEVFRDVGSAKHLPVDDNFIDIYEFPLPPDSSLLLCSDGLTDLLTSQQIFSAYQAHKNFPRIFVESLITGANEAGGKDNITVLVVTNLPRAGASRHIFLETQEIVVDAISGEITAENMKLDAPPKTPSIIGIFFSRPAFLIYGILLTVLAYLAWQFLIAQGNLSLPN
jgi:serine/threonine protein phosphatase PrpC